MLQFRILVESIAVICCISCVYSLMGGRPSGAVHDPEMEGGNNGLRDPELEKCR